MNAVRPNSNPRRRRHHIGALVVLTLTGSVTTTLAQQAILASPRNTVIPPTEFATKPAISADGRQVAFMSQAAATTYFFNPMSQIYVFNRITGQVATVSSSNGLASGLGTSRSENPSISQNGRFVAFSSPAIINVPNLVGNGIYILDRDADNDAILDELGTGRKLTIGSTSNSSGNPNQYSQSDQPSFSGAGGRFMTFISKTATLVPGGVNTGYDVYVKDRDLDTDGIFDEFVAGAHKTIRVSVNSAGQPANDISNAAHPVISADGRFVAYESDANNLVADDTNGLRDIFLHDRDTDADNIFDEPGAISTVRISVADDGTQSDAPSYSPTISGDGRYIAFSSSASTLVPGLAGRPFPQIYVYDRTTRLIRLISRALSGAPAPSYCLAPSLSSDGGTLAFLSASQDLVETSTTGDLEIVLWRSGAPLNGISLVVPPGPPEFGFTEPALAANGRYIAATSMSRDLGADGGPTVRDAFIVDPTPCVPEPSIATTLVEGCVASTITLRVETIQTGPFQYQWFHDGSPLPGAIASTLTISNAQLDHTGAYSALVTSNCASVMSNPANVTIYGPPVITSQPAPVDACQFRSYTLRVVAVGRQPLTYAWYRNGVLQQSGSNSQIVQSSDQSATYYVVVGSPCGATLSNLAFVYVEASPTILIQPTSQIACPGGSVQLSVSARGVNALHYQWYAVPFYPIPGAVNSTYDISPVTDQVVGLYNVVVSDQCGSTSSQEVNVYVSPPVLTSQPASQSACVGTPVTLAVQAIGAGSVSYQWFKNQIAIPGATSRTYFLPGAAESDSGSYFVRVTDDCFSTNSNNATLAVTAFSTNCVAWTERHPSVSPSARSRHAMVFDSVRHQTVMFGGETAAPDDAVWLWDGNNWQSRSTTTFPPQRSAFGMAYDAARDSVVIFGGLARDGTLLNDTWTWNGSVWTQMSPPGERPPVRSAFGMAYDARRERVVLFGGKGDFSVSLSDTWEWDGSAWLLRGPVTAPSGRFDLAMAYDAARQRVVLYSGSNGLGDTWEYDGVVWARITMFGPGGRARHAMAFVDWQPGTFQLGNFAAPVWTVSAWSQGAWTTANPSPAPIARWGTAMSYDTDRQKLVIFGGMRQTNPIALGDTWELR